MDRSIAKAILRDLETKIVLISGPRQAGKTTLAKKLKPSFDYFNFDFAEHRVAMRERSWDRNKPLVVFDELHKMRSWKSWLKGIYDVEGIPPAIVVTGSARLETARKTGDSLAGRFFQHRLHPFDAKELSHEIEPQKSLARLMTVGGFPEPFLQNDPTFYKRWRRTHVEMILRQDLLDLTSIRQITGVQTLLEMLRLRVGSTVSHANLAKDLQVDPKTVSEWISILENLYVVFAVPTFSRRIARTLLKAKKYYFFDTGQVQGDVGARLENVVACALLKEIHRLEDQTGEHIRLHYIRTKDGKEVDFAVAKDNVLTHLIEVKHKNPTPSDGLSWAQKKTQTQAKMIQVVKELNRERTYPNGVQVKEAANWLATLDLG